MAEITDGIMGATNLSEQEQHGLRSSSDEVPSSSSERMITRLPPDPSVPHEDGTCFWDKLPLELMQLILELVYPTGQKMRPIGQKGWESRERSEQAAKKRKDRTAGKPFPGPYIERFLGVCKSWFQAVSTLFYARVTLAVCPGAVLRTPPAYLSSLTSISVYVWGMLDAKDLGELVAGCPAISSLDLTMDKRFFSDMIEVDLSINADRFQETDFDKHEPTATLLRAVCGVSRVAIKAQLYSFRPENSRFAANMLLLEQMAAASTKSPRRAPKEPDTCLSRTKAFQHLEVLTSPPASSGLIKDTKLPEDTKTLQVDNLPRSLAQISALLENDSVGLVEFFSANQASLLEYFERLRSKQAKAKSELRLRGGD
jgi:hypothetical protein